MNYSRLALAAVVTWAVSLVVGYVANGYLMADLYAAHTSVFRPDAEMNMIVGFVGSLLGFFVFAYMYAKGYEGTSGLQEGLRFGVLVGLLLMSFGAIWNYVVLQVSNALGLAWAVDVLVEMAIYGTLVGVLYRPRAVAGK